jgi:hypothetical protein
MCEPSLPRLHSGATNRSDQTRRGIAAARERGVQFGRAGRALADRNAAAAKERADRLRPLVAELIALGVRRPSYLARCLNRMGVPTARGGWWRTSTAVDVLNRLGPSLNDDVLAAAASGIGWRLEDRLSYQEWLALRSRARP